MDNVSLIILSVKSIINLLDVFCSIVQEYCREENNSILIIQWSEEAIQAVQARFGSEAKVWKLVFDSEGCGCSVDGVAALWAITAPEIGELQADSNQLEVWYEKRHEVFFDHLMRISYLPEHRSFKLASDGQIYSNRLKLDDKRKSIAEI